MWSSPSVESSDSPRGVGAHSRTPSLSHSPTHSHSAQAAINKISPSPPVSRTTSRTASINAKSNHSIMQQIHTHSADEWCYPTDDEDEEDVDLLVRKTSSSRVANPSSSSIGAGVRDPLVRSLLRRPLSVSTSRACAPLAAAPRSLTAASNNEQYQQKSHDNNTLPPLQTNDNASQTPHFSSPLSPTRGLASPLSPHLPSKFYGSLPLCFKPHERDAAYCIGRDKGIAEATRQRQRQRKAISEQRALAAEQQSGDAAARRKAHRAAIKALQQQQKLNKHHEATVRETLKKEIEKNKVKNLLFHLQAARTNEKCKSPPPPTTSAPRSSLLPLTSLNKSLAINRLLLAKLQQRKELIQLYTNQHMSRDDVLIRDSSLKDKLDELDEQRAEQQRRLDEKQSDDEEAQRAARQRARMEARTAMHPSLLNRPAHFKAASDAHTSRGVMEHTLHSPKVQRPTVEWPHEYEGRWEQNRNKVNKSPKREKRHPKATAIASTDSEHSASIVSPASPCVTPPLTSTQPPLSQDQHNRQGPEESPNHLQLHDSTSSYSSA